MDTFKMFHVGFEIEFVMWCSIKMIKAKSKHEIQVKKKLITYLLTTLKYLTEHFCNLHMLRCNLLKNEKSLVRNFLYLIFDLLRYFTLLMHTYVQGLVTLRHDARCSVYFMRHVFNGTMAQLWSENLVSARDYFFSMAFLTMPGWQKWQWRQTQ